MADPDKAAGPDFGAGISISAVPDGGMLSGHVGGDEVLLARVGDELFAVGAH